MKSVWHIARKDIRRFAIPTAMWLVFVLVMTLGFRSASLPIRGDAGRTAVDWIMALSTWTQLIMVMQFVVGYLLAGALALEDPILSTTAFWQGRPIGRRRLFVAKLIAAAVLFVIAPALALTPAWLAFGFSFGDVVAAARDVMMWQACVIVPGMALGSLTANLRQFLLCSIAVFGAYFVAAAYGVSASLIPAPVFDVLRSRNFIVQFALLPAMSVILAHQYLSHRYRFGWALVALWLGATAMTRVAWPWNIMPPGPPGWPSATVSAGRHEDVVMSAILLAQNSVAVTVTLSQPTGADTFLAPFAGRGELRWDDGTAAVVTLWRGANWAETAAAQLVKREGGTRAVPWQMQVSLPADVVTRWQSRPAIFTGDLLLADGRARVVGEMALEPGAQIRAGSNRVRLLSAQASDGRLRMLLEERQAFASWDRPHFDSRGNLARVHRNADAYLLADRPGGTMKFVPASDAGEAAMNGFQLTLRHLDISSEWRGENPSAPEGGAMVKVTFEPARYWRRTITIERLPLATEEKQP
ncbi:MAG: hypothetical protein Q7S40_33375 [Opitutaceae bacterium]|nr:hypothetical protein [Opitutaceae bacterium]